MAIKEETTFINKHLNMIKTMRPTVSKSPSISSKSDISSKSNKIGMNYGHSRRAKSSMGGAKRDLSNNAKYLTNNYNNYNKSLAKALQENVTTPIQSALETVKS